MATEPSLATTVENANTCLIQFNTAAKQIEKALKTIESLEMLLPSNNSLQNVIDMLKMALDELFVVSCKSTVNSLNTTLNKCNTRLIKAKESTVQESQPILAANVVPPPKPLDLTKYTVHPHTHNVVLYRVNEISEELASITVTFHTTTTECRLEEITYRNAKGKITNIITCRMVRPIVDASKSILIKFAYLTPSPALILISFCHDIRRLTSVEMKFGDKISYISAAAPHGPGDQMELKPTIYNGCAFDTYAFQLVGINAASAGTYALAFSASTQHCYIQSLTCMTHNKTSSYQRIFNILTHIVDSRTALQYEEDNAIYKLLIEFRNSICAMLYIDGILQYIHGGSIHVSSQ